MRILIVAPGPRFSTFDTFTYYHRAFKSLGHDVFAFRYHDHFAYHATALEYMTGESPDTEELQMNAIGMSAEDLISRIARVKPELIFIVSALALPMQIWDWLDTFKSALKEPYKVMVLFTESPYIDESQVPILERIDIAATTDLASLDKFRDINKRSIYVRHAYCDTVHKRMPADAWHRSDVFMVGTGFPERIKLLAAVDWSDIDLRIFGGNWGDLKESEILEGFYSLDFLDNQTEVVSYYSNSAISLNVFRTAKWPGENVLHIEPDLAYSVSPRCYEVMACGGFLLTDTRPELCELFSDGKDFVSFDGPEDLEEKVRFFLSRPVERERIAESGLWAVEGHTYKNRATEIIKYVSTF